RRNARRGAAPHRRGHARSPGPPAVETADEISGELVDSWMAAVEPRWHHPPLQSGYRAVSLDWPRRRPDPNDCPTARLSHRLDPARHVAPHRRVPLFGRLPKIPFGLWKVPA